MDVPIPLLLDGPPTSYAMQIYAMGEEGCCFYVFRSVSMQNIQTSMKYGIWATMRKNERLMNEAISRKRYVILFFVANLTHFFSGWALLLNRPGQSNLPASLFFAPNMKTPFDGKSFDIQWIRKIPVRFDEYQHRYPEDPFQFFRGLVDGTELPPTVGVRLCELYEERWRELGGHDHIIPTQSYVPPSYFHTYCYPHLAESAESLQKKMIQDYVWQKEGTNKKIVQNDPGSHGAQIQEDSFRKNENTVTTASENIDSSTMHNPALQIFPVDLTSMSYEDYIMTYQRSKSLFQ